MIWLSGGYFEVEMTTLDFAKGWIRLVMECVTTMKFNVLFNGELLGSIILGQD